MKKQFENRIRKIRQHFREMVFPEKFFCIGCERILTPVNAPPDDVLCLECIRNLRQRFLAPDDRFTGLFVLDAVSAFAYADLPRQLVLELKHNTVSHAADPLIPYLAEAVRSAFPSEPDTVVTWVPMPEKRLQERCIDHGRILAEALAAGMGLECRSLLKRTSDGHTQQGLNQARRRTNIKGQFSPAESRVPPRVLLVDDVLTTGSTLKECAGALKKAGCRQVRAVTVCKVR